MLTSCCGVLALTTELNAATLVLEFDTRGAPAELDIPEAFADLRERFRSNPASGEFTVRIILPNFERYASGTHEIPMNIGNGLNWGPNRDDDPDIRTAGLSMTLESPTLGMLEGVRTRVQAENAAGEPVAGAVLLPDESQLGDYGSISISDGNVTGFSYGWTEPDNPGLVSMTDYLTGRRGLPIGMLALTIEVTAFSAPAKFGDVVLVTGMDPAIRVAMGPAE